MRHFASPEFWQAYENLLDHVRAVADRNYALLKLNPHILLCISKRSAGIGRFVSGAAIGALAVEVDKGLLWFWIGTLAQYDGLIG